MTIVPVISYRHVHPLETLINHEINFAILFGSLSVSHWRVFFVVSPEIFFLKDGGTRKNNKVQAGEFLVKGTLLVLAKSVKTGFIFPTC